MGHNFLVVGPLQVRGGNGVELRRLSHRRLLSILLLDAGRRQTTDVLIERFWGDDPPEQPKAARCWPTVSLPCPGPSRTCSSSISGVGSTPNATWNVKSFAPVNIAVVAVLLMVPMFAPSPAERCPATSLP
jgi:hypothetical protein